MRWLVLAAAAISLSGCGLPPTVTYTSYAADVFSPSGPEAVTARRPAKAPFPLYFALDSDRLTVAGQTVIDAAVTAAGKIGATDFAVTGHVGLVGPDRHNIKLSLRRAKVVSEALVARGIDPAWISIANQVTVELAKTARKDPDNDGRPVVRRTVR